MGAIVPVDKAQVYELEPGYTVRNGKIVREDPTPVAKTVLTYVPEQGVSDG
jgi:hypothetical protein